MSKSGDEPIGLTSVEAAALLRISTRTLLDWRKAGKVTYLQLSPRVIRFRREDLEALLDDSARRAQPVPREKPRRQSVGATPGWCDSSRINPLTRARYGSFGRAAQR